MKTGTLYFYKGKSVLARSIIDDPKENHLNIPSVNVYSRLSHGMSLERALSFPVKKVPKGIKRTFVNNFRECPAEIKALIQTEDYNINEFIRVCNKVQNDPDYQKSRQFKKRQSPKYSEESRRKMSLKKRAV